MKSYRWFARAILVVGAGFLAYAVYLSMGSTSLPSYLNPTYQQNQRAQFEQSTNGKQNEEVKRSEYPPLSPDRSMRERLQKLGAVPATLSASEASFTLPDLMGDTHTLKQYRGLWILLNFWATWCPPCREEMPSMQRLWEHTHRRGGVVLAVNVGEKKSMVSEFVREYELTFPVLLDSSGKVSKAYGVSGLPTTWLIDPKGRPFAQVMGPREWDRGPPAELFEQLINK